MIRAKIAWDQSTDHMHVLVTDYENLKSRHLTAEGVWKEHRTGDIIEPFMRIPGPMWEAIATAFRDWDSRNVDIGLLKDMVEDARKTRDQALNKLLGKDNLP